MNTQQALACQSNIGFVKGAITGALRGHDECVTDMAVIKEATLRSDLHNVKKPIVWLAKRKTPSEHRGMFGKAL